MKPHEAHLSPQRRAYLRGQRRTKRLVRLCQLSLLAGLFATWELAARAGARARGIFSPPARRRCAVRAVVVVLPK